MLSIVAEGTWWRKTVDSVVLVPCHSDGKTGVAGSTVLLRGSEQTTWHLAAHGWLTSIVSGAQHVHVDVDPRGSRGFDRDRDRATIRSADAVRME